GPTSGLNAALQSSDGAIRSEAAVALGTIAARTGTPADPMVVAALGEAVAREVVRTAVVLDGDESRSAAVASALEKKNVFVNRWTSGARGVGLRSEEHTSELQSQSNLVCRLLLEKKKYVRLHAAPCHQMTPSNCPFCVRTPQHLQTSCKLPVRLPRTSLDQFACTYLSIQPLLLSP